MFEVGKAYYFTVIETGIDGSHESRSWFEVAAIDGTLLRLLGPDYSEDRFSSLLATSETPIEREVVILNTASAFFHSATPATEVSHAGD